MKPIKPKDKDKKKKRGADKVGNVFIPDFSKPKGNRRRVLDKINALNKGDR